MAAGVFVLDRRGRPLMQCSPKRAKKLLAAGRARVHKLFPFVIRIVDRTVEQSALQPLRLSIDPGSKTTGMAISRIEEVTDADGVVEPVMHIGYLMELAHRGHAIKESLHARSAMRRRRRGNLRYRAPRFDNRVRRAGWLPPSLQHRVDTTCAWVSRFRRFAPITHLAQELVRFDMQQMQNPEIAGIEYQQGTLAGYEVREYLLEKFGRSCAYCDKQDLPLQIEHIHAKAKGGTNRVSNLTLACGPCNTKKGARDVREFLVKEPKRLEKILRLAKAPLRDAAAVNATRWALLNALKKTSLPVETGSGGGTKWNRSRLGIPKTHALDAACVGVAADVRGVRAPTLRVTCTGRGSRSRTRLNKYGFPRACLTRTKTVEGFRTGDMVTANVTKGKKTGVHKGRVAIRMAGFFNIQTGIAGVATVQGISHKDCRIVQRADGYGYAWPKQLSQQPKTKATTAERSAPFLTDLKDGVSRSNP
jgi:5-methylcytosine-specific restriction endonuclease McrA